MKPYVEQSNTYDNGRGKIFTVRLFCQGTYDFTITDYNANPITQVTSIDVHFVHECIQAMRGWREHGEDRKVDSSAMDTLP